MSAQRVFGVLFVMVGFWLLSMGVNPTRFIAGHFLGAPDLATAFYVPGMLAMILGCFLMLFGPGGKRA